MASYRVQPIPGRRLSGELAPPADKSISHRSLIFGALAQGTSAVRNLLRGEDVLRTQKILQDLGVSIEDSGNLIKIHGRGLQAFRRPEAVLYCGNSGTTMRLMMGLLSAQPFTSELTGDASLNRRPMGRVMVPLASMGAKFNERQSPQGRVMSVLGGALTGIDYHSPIASAQVKSAVLLAGLYADGATSVEEPYLSRDHTERFLKSMGADIEVADRKVTLRPGKTLEPFELTVPGDPSSAAFFIVAALLVPGSELTIRDICLNPTRAALIDVLLRMGARIDRFDERTLGGKEGGELIGSLRVRASELKATDVGADEVPWLIDEIPILSLAFARAEGVSALQGAEELRVKESDRIAQIVKLLKTLGVPCQEYPDGFKVTGVPTWQGGKIESDGDHRIAMTSAIAGLLSERGMHIEDTECVATSFPGFAETLTRLGGIIKTD